MGWLSGWTYRKTINVSRSSGAVTNYQMCILVGESNGSGTHDVSCEGHCKSDFSDLRFTNSDGITLLDYWIESVSGTTPNQVAKIWVEFDSIGTTDTTFYLYYGNAGAAAYSNGANTFPFFDDFPGSALDTSKWFHWLTAGTTTVSGSILSIVGNASYEAQGAKAKFGTSYAFRARAYISAESGTDVGIFTFDDRSADGNYTGSGYDFAQFQLTNNNKDYNSAREGTAFQDIRTEDLTSYSILEIRRNGSTDVRFLQDDLPKHTKTTDVPLDDCGILLYSNNPSVTLYCDWVLVRQWLISDPAFGSWGTEEVASISVTQPMAGGLILGGSSSFFENIQIYEQAMRGGMLLGGSSNLSGINLQFITQAMRGGIVLGGSQRIGGNLALLGGKLIPIGVVTLFTGQVSEIELGRSYAKVKVKSNLELFNVQWPVNVYMRQCLWTLYSAGCGINKADFTVSGNVLSGSTNFIVNVDTPNASDFDQGVITFTSGANEGATRTIRGYLSDSGSIEVVQGLPYAPEAGDTFEMYPGCDKSQDQCLSKFNNLANWRGFPYIPAPETAI